jgi:hypothetical protein
MLPSRSWGGDPAATHRTSACGSTPSPPRRRGDPKPASAVGAVNIRLQHKYGVLLEMGVEGPPTPCAQTGSRRMAAIFFLRMVNMLAATGAEGGRGGGGARCAMDPYGHATTSRFCLPTPGGGRRAPRTAAFCLLGVNGLLASAAAAEGGGRCSRSPNVLVLAPTRELAAEVRSSFPICPPNPAR